MVKSKHGINIGVPEELDPSAVAAGGGDEKLESPDPEQDYPDQVEEIPEEFGSPVRNIL